jgi:hypothetical protein
MLNNLVALAIQWQWIFANLSPQGFAQASSTYILIVSLVNLSYTPLLFTFRYVFLHMSLISKH